LAICGHGLHQSNSDKSRIVIAVNNVSIVSKVTRPIKAFIPDVQLFLRRQQATEDVFDVKSGMSFCTHTACIKFDIAHAN